MFSYQTGRAHTLGQREPGRTDAQSFGNTSDDDVEEAADAEAENQEEGGEERPGPGRHRRNPSRSPAS